MSALGRAIEKSIRRNKRRQERLAHKARQQPASAEYTDNGHGPAPAPVPLSRTRRPHARQQQG